MEKCIGEMAAYAAVGFAAVIRCRAVPQLWSQIYAVLTLIGQDPYHRRFAESVLREGNQDLRRRVLVRFQMEQRDRLVPLVQEAERTGAVYHQNRSMTL